ncbi:TPA: hypothetical protein IXZ54_001570 [Enterococcus faecium]|nr:hypothetical protein [Enterococcus faecium]
MSEKIIYADRPFRDEFIEEIHTIAPGYIFKTELQPEDLQNVEISLGALCQMMLVKRNLRIIGDQVDQFLLIFFS